MEEYSAEALRSKVMAGYKGGSMFQDMAASPAKRFVDGVDPLVAKKLEGKEAPAGKTSK